MRKWAALCAVSALMVTPVYGSTVYQSDLDDAVSTVPGTFQDIQTPDDVNIKIVRKGTVSSDKPSLQERMYTRVDANHMKMNDITGDVEADGDVVVKRGTEELRAPRVEGNTKTGQYQTKGDSYRYLVDGGKTKDLSGHELHYNANTKEAYADSAIGWSEPYYIKGTNITFDGEVGHIQRGVLTTKHAMAFEHSPDYRIQGENIEVYPGDKAIIHHASFFVKNVRLLSLNSYTVSLRNDKEKKISLFDIIPTPSYTSDDGFGLRGSFDYPVSKRGEWYVDYGWYSKVGFKPKIGYRHHPTWGTISGGYSRESDEYHNRTVWIEKKWEVRADTHAFHFGNTPFYIRGGANIGYWKEEEVKGLHNEVYTQVSHDPIRLWDGASLRFLVGYQRDYYEYNHKVRSMPYWGARFNVRINPRLSAFAAYTQRNIDYNNSPYPFDTTEIPKEFVYGGSFRIARLDDLSAAVTLDVNTGRIDSVNYTWHHNLHSLDTYVTYKSREKSWEVKVLAKDF